MVDRTHLLSTTWPQDCHWTITPFSITHQPLTDLLSSTPTWSASPEPLSLFVSWLVSDFRCVKPKFTVPAKYLRILFTTAMCWPWVIQKSHSLIDNKWAVPPSDHWQTHRRSYTLLIIPYHFWISFILTWTIIPANLVTLPIVTKLWVSVRKSDRDGCRVSLTYFTCGEHDICGKKQETSVQVSIRHPTLFVWLQELWKWLKDRHHVGCSEDLDKKTSSLVGECEGMCNERLKAKSEGSTRLTYTRFRGGLGFLCVL